MCATMASKNIIAELNKDDKLDGDNYDIWHCKVQCILKEQDVLETLNHMMVEPKYGNTQQRKRDHEAFLT